VIVTPGQLVAFSTKSPSGAAASGSDCPAKRVLRETGKKLFPGVHSGILTPMVSVYDNIKLWHGYIDPNAAVFASYSTNTPNFFKNGVDAVTGAPPDAGAPVITNGLVTAGTFVYAGSGIGYQTGSGGYIEQQTSKSTDVTLNKPTGEILTNAANLDAGDSVFFTLTNSFIKENDIVVLNWNMDAYNLNAFATRDDKCAITIYNISGSNKAESITIRFAVIKGAKA
jgi:hypothetical protein